MDQVLHFDTVGQYNTFNQHETLHPLVSVIDYSKAHPRKLRRSYFGFYGILLKDVKCGDLRYGKHLYDYQEGTIVFISPGQIVGIETSEELYQPKGHGVVFHPDLIRGTNLGKLIDQYSFFSYDMHEALHISEKERQLVLDCMAKIRYETERPVDKYSKSLIAGNIELLLGYCVRFYDRQFITRDHVNKGILEKFEQSLCDFFLQGKSQENGLPTVTYFAASLNLSANYFGDLIKKETGKTANEYIQLKLINMAKRLMFEEDKDVSETAYALGFKYPQHFTRFFKKHVGLSPLKYKQQHGV